MFKRCPSCSKKTYQRIDSAICKIKPIGDRTTGCGQVDFEVWHCNNEFCPNFKKKQTKNIPCQCVKKHDENK